MRLMLVKGVMRRRCGYASLCVRAGRDTPRERRGLVQGRGRRVVGAAGKIENCKRLWGEKKNVRSTA